MEQLKDLLDDDVDTLNNLHAKLKGIVNANDANGVEPNWGLKVNLTEEERIAANTIIEGIELVFE